MHYVYRFLLVKYGFGKEWKCIPKPHGAMACIEMICGCQARKRRIGDPIEFEKIQPLPWKTRVYKQRWVFLWSGECTKCDTVYFALATKPRLPTDFEAWTNAQKKETLPD